MTTTRTSRLLAAAALVVAVLAAGGTTATANTSGLPADIVGLSATGSAAAGDTYTDHFWTIKEPSVMGRGCAVAEAGGSRGSHKLTVTAEQPGTVLCSVTTRYSAVTVSVAFGRADTMPDTGKCHDGYKARIIWTPAGDFAYCWHAAPAPAALQPGRPATIDLPAHGPCPPGYTRGSHSCTTTTTAASPATIDLPAHGPCPPGYTRGSHSCTTTTTAASPGYSCLSGFRWSSSLGYCTRPHTIDLPAHGPCPPGYTRGSHSCTTTTTAASPGPSCANRA